MDILVPVNRHFRELAGPVRFAARLAARVDGTLTGLYVFEPQIALAESPLPVFISEAVSYMQEHLKDAAAADRAFVQFARDHGVAHARWEVVQGGYAPAIARAGVWNDLVVLGRDLDEPRGSLAMIGEVLMTSDLPCVVVPKDVEEAALDHVALAWNGRPEGTRAIRAALPLLHRAGRVTLLAGERVKLAAEGPDWTPPRELTDWLSQHGVRFDSRAITGDNAGAAILAAVDEIGANLLVMGAYGRGRFREWALGGATRHVLEHAGIPVLLRH